MTGRLYGRVVAVTREEEAAAPLSAALGAAGASVRFWPTLAFADAHDAAPLACALSRFESYDWVTFTSARAVDSVTRRCSRTGPVPRVAAVGDGTAARLRASDWPVDVVGEGDGAVGLVRAMAGLGGLEGRKVLFPAGNLARTDLEEGLRALGAEVERVEAYQTLVCPPDPLAVRRDLSRGVHVVVFSSPSAVRGLDAALEGDLAGGLGACVAVASGPTTLAALAAEKVEQVVVAMSPSPEGLVDACVRAVEGR